MSEPDDTPAAQLERYLANVEERPRHQPKPLRWWHWLVMAGWAIGFFALATRMLRLW